MFSSSSSFSRHNPPSFARTALTVLCSTILLCGDALAQVPVHALPTGGSIAAGQASFGRVGNSLTITQGTDRAVINWGSFDIGAEATVRFQQPGSGSVALNRVAAGNPSTILGSLGANGSVWLVNPSGVVFGQSAQVDVAGLVASSLALSDGDFMSGRNQFHSGAGAGAVINQGRINAAGGVVALIGAQVKNSGSISAQGGTAALAAGDKVSLDFVGDGLINLKIERSVLDAAVENSGRISADGGMVVLSSRSANDAVNSIVNNTGLVEARGLVSRNGRILLDGGNEGGTVNSSGSLDVSSVSGRGGDITVTGSAIRLDGAATLDASGATGGGTIKVGGGWQGKDDTVSNARVVFVGPDAKANASATQKGDGGTVVFWSDDSTRFAGSIEAKGGEAGGNGGKVEVSGKQFLSYTGRTNALAPKGLTGDLMLDPATVDIVSGGTGAGAITGSSVKEKDLEAQLANVLIQATGNINVADLSLNGGDGKISMGNNISLRIEAGTTSTNSVPGSIIFANAANTLEVFGTGSIMLDAGSNGTTGGGNITNAPILIAHGAGSNPGVLPAFNLSEIGTGTPTPGSITLYGADGVTTGGSITTNGGYVRIWADSDNAGGGGFTLGASSPISTNGGDLHISSGNDPISLNASMTLGAGRLYFRSDGDKSSGAKTLGAIIDGSGNITVTTPFIMNAGSGIRTDGLITLSSNVTLNTGAGALTLRGSAINFSGATMSNLSTASLILEPANPATSMDLGGASGFASAATLSALPGIKNLTIGRRDATGAINVPGNFSFDANGSLELINGTVNVSGGTLTNTTGNIVLTGDTVNIAKTVSANGGNGSVTIRQMTAGAPINLGTGLTDSAVGHINAATLVIGRADGGNLTFDSDITTTATNVHLLSGNQVIANAGGVAATNLAVSAQGGASLTDSTFSFNTLALDVGGPTTVNKAAAYTLGTVNGVSGLNIRSGTDATVTLASSNALNSGVAPIALNGNASTVTFRASEVILSGSTVTGSSNTSFVVEPSLATANYSVGGAGTFLSTASFNKLTGSANVQIGRTDGTGIMNIGADLSLAVPGTLSFFNGAIGVPFDVANTTGSLLFSSALNGMQIDGDLSAAALMTLWNPAGGSVTGVGKLSADRLYLYGPTTTFGLGATHSVGTMAGSVYALSFNNSGTLTVGSAGGFDGLEAGLSLELRTAGATSDIIVNKGVAANGSGVALVLDAGRNFINNAGAGALGVAGEGTWNVYSTSPLNDTRGGVTYAFKQYNSSFSDTVLGAGNGFIYRTAPSITVGLTGSVSKTYDASATATLTSGHYTTSGEIDGDSVTFSSTGATYANKNVGAGKNVTAAGLSLTGATNDGVTVYGYQLAGSTATSAIGEITPKQLTVGTATVANKVYDTHTTATVTGVALTGVVNGDTLGTSATSAFADKNVANGKAVAVTGISLTGTDSSNYALDTTVTTGTANITPALITVGASTVANKIYDGGTDATVTGVSLAGILGSDTVSAAANGSWDTKNVGSGKTVSVSNVSLGGTDSGNYALDKTVSSGTGEITRALLTVGSASVSDKIYDYTTNATVTGVALVGVVGGDTLTTTATGSFADKNVGHGKEVTVTGITLGGTDAGNYTLDTTASSGTASITPALLSVGLASIGNKVYDRTTGATVNGVALTGLFGTDSVTTTATGSFADKNAGNGKVVAVTGITLGGVDAANYSLDATTSSGTANITPALLTVGTAAISHKVYDGNTIATVGQIDLTGVLGSDVLTTSATGAFADKNVGSGKTVAVSGITLGGADAGNYTLSSTGSSGMANITPATLTIGAATVVNKIYDGWAAVNVAAVDLSGIVAGDDIDTTATGAFADKNVGSGRTVNVTGVTLTGMESGNYVLNTTATTGVGDIGRKTITIGANQIANKVYDGTTQADIITTVFTGMAHGDDLRTTGHGTFDNKNVGTGKSVTFTGVELAGVDAGNYTLVTTGSSGTADITPAMLTVGTANIVSKIYDGSAAVTVDSVNLTGVVAGDDIGTTSSGAFLDKNVGMEKAVSVSDIVVTGLDASNYILSTTAAVGTGDISRKTITIGANQVADKIYDGTTKAEIVTAVLTGMVKGDDLRTTGQGAFDTKNVGKAKMVSFEEVGLSGTDAGNYTLVTTGSSGTAAVTPATLTVGGASIASKVYDGSTAIGVNSVSIGGIVDGDDVGSTAKGAFGDKNVGQGKQVFVSDIAIHGADAGNYVLNTTKATGKGNITPASLQIGNAAVADKVYDGTVRAEVVSVAFTGLVAGDEVATQGDGAFENKNAGSDKTVTFSNLAITGADAGNYTFSTIGSSAKADITPATVNVSSITIGEKVSDGTNQALVGEIFLEGVVAGDELAASGDGRYLDLAPGDNKAVTVGPLTLGGVDAGNYRLGADTFITTGRIKPAQSSAAISALTSPVVSTNGTSPSRGSSDVGSSSANFGGQTGASNSSGGTAGSGNASGIFGAIDGAANHTGGMEGLTHAAGNSSSSTAGAGAGNSSLPGNSREAVMIEGSVLTGNGGTSLAFEFGEASSPVSATVPVYRERAGETLAPEGQFIVTDNGTTLSMLPFGVDSNAMPSLSADVTRSTRASVPIQGGGPAVLAIELLSDGTLHVKVSAEGDALSSDTLATYAMVVAKQSFAISVESISAVVLNRQSENKI